MTTKPRPYQWELCDAGIQYLEESDKNGIIVSPTGTGKSLTNNMLLKHMSEEYKGFRSIVVTDDRKIVSQNCQSLYNYWPQAKAGIFSAGLKQRDTASDIIFAGIQSIYNCPHEFGYTDLLVVDECHMVGPRSDAMYGKLIAGLRKDNADLRIIGYSATPYRLGMGLLTEGDVFHDVIIDYSKTDKFCWFIDEGYLSPLVTKKTQAQIDLSQVPILMGNYNDKILEMVADNHDLNFALVREVIQHGQTRNFWLGFCSGLTHAQHLKETFLACGVSVEIVHGKMSEAEQDRIEADFRNGRIRCLLNVNIYNKGWDFDALDLIFVARGTLSVAWWLQVLGRGTRPLYHPRFSREDLETTAGRLAAIAAGNKPDGCLVLDFARNTEKCGPVNDPILPRKRKKGDTIGEAPVKSCGECGAYQHTRATECSVCGAVFPPSSCLEQTASTDAVMVRSAATPVIDILPTPIVHYSSQPCRKDTAKGTMAKISYTHASKFLLTIDQFLFPELPEEDWMRKKFVNFWKKAGGRNPVPATAEEFLVRARAELKTPTAVHFTSNTKYPDVREIHY